MWPLIPVHWDDKQPLPDPDRAPLDPRTARSLFALGVGGFAVALMGLFVYVAIDRWLDDPRWRARGTVNPWQSLPAAVVIAVAGAALLVIARKRASRRLPWIVPALFGLAAIVIAIARVAMGNTQSD